MIRQRLAAVVLVLAFVASLPGCAALILGGAAAAGTYVYVDGQAKQDYNVGIDKAYNATLAAVQQLGLKVEKKSKQLAEASVTAKDGDTTVWIDLSSKADTVTTVSVRYGVTGDEQASQRIQSAIQKNL